MHKNNFTFVLLPLLFISGCSNNNNIDNSELYTFNAISLSQNGKEMEYRCVLYSDQSGELNFDTSYSFTWTDTNAGFTFELPDKTIHTNYDKFTAMHYFFIEKGGETYRFSCRDSSYQKKLNEEYAPFYEVKTTHLFKGEGMTSGIKTEGSISLLDDEDKTVYYAPMGMDGIETKTLTISQGWKFENEVYSFSLNGKQYKSKNDAEKGITIEISNIEYTLVEE